MTAWANKRFWTTATHEVRESGFAIMLDKRQVQTPGKVPLILPTEALALAVAAEWNAQVQKIDPSTMPMTRRANAAIDKVSHQHAEVADMLAAYGETDLLCHRAAQPEALIARQAAAWDPVLDWLDQRHGVRLKVVTGVIHANQAAPTLASLSTLVHALSDFQLTAFHDLVAMSGSLVLALALIDGQKTPDQAWSLSRIDEAWQEEQWGIDAESAEVAARKRAEFLEAARFFTLSGK